MPQCLTHISILGYGETMLDHIIAITRSTEAKRVRYQEEEASAEKVRVELAAVDPEDWVRETIELEDGC